jgi:hypothetical protein
MKWLGVVLMSGVLLAPVWRCVAETGCATLSVRQSIDAVREDLTLADLLSSEVCPRMRQVAAQVSLGKAPRAGTLRVIEGQQIRALLVELASANAGSTAGLQIPDRIVVRRAGATKSCVEIADFLAGAAPSQDERLSSHLWRKNLECGAIRGIAEDAELELVKAAWDAGLRRWEFLLRCARPEDCVPFMVSARDEKLEGLQGNSAHATSSGKSSAGVQSAAGFSLLVRPGETALLTWDQSGIRVTLPVTCLDAGGLGQYVRVRLKNAPQILRAEVVGARAVQVKL